MNPCENFPEGQMKDPSKESDKAQSAIAHRETVPKLEKHPTIMQEPEEIDFFARADEPLPKKKKNKSRD